MQGKADDLRVLLHRRFDDHLGRLPQPRVDHLITRVTQRASHDLDAAVVAVEANLGEQDPHRLRGRLGGRHLR